MITEIEYEYLLHETEKDKYPILLSGEWVFRDKVMTLLSQYELEKKGNDHV